MPRKSAAPRPGPRLPADLNRIEEANVARLGLISIQERIPDSFVSWTVDFSVDGRPARLTCDAVTKHGGVPHGLDGDIATALTVLFVEAGSPADGVLYTTPYQILRRAGLDTSGRYYQNLLQTLLRLRMTTYTASEGWRDHRQGNWTTVTFNYLAELEYTSENDQTQITGTSVLKLRLADPIVKSIKAKYTKPLDLDFITSLDRPLTRALYRLLDARRYPAIGGAEPLEVLQVNLVAWGEACKIIDRRANKIRATLQGAHDELIERGYLEHVEYEGRGLKQTLTYHFVDLRGGAVPTELLGRLMAHRVSGPVAKKLLEEFGEDHVRERLSKFERLVSGGYKARNSSALLVDVIRDSGDKYPEKASAKPPPAYMPTLEEAAAEDGPLEARVELAIKTMQFLLRERLSVSEYALLRMGLITEEIGSSALTQAATRAKAAGRLDEFTTELLDTLHGLHARTLTATP